MNETLATTPAPPARDPYPSDLTDEDWSQVSETLESAPRVFARTKGSGGRPTSVDLRAVADGVLYQARTGIPWRYLPRDIFPAWETVYAYGTAWAADGTMQRLCDALGLRWHPEVLTGPTILRGRGRASRRPERTAAVGPASPKGANAGNQS